MSTAGTLPAHEPGVSSLRQLRLTVAALAELGALAAPFRRPMRALLERPLRHAATTVPLPSPTSALPPSPKSARSARLTALPATVPAAPRQPTRRLRPAPPPAAAPTTVSAALSTPGVAALDRGRARLISLRRPANIAFLVVLATVLTAWWVALRPTSFLGGPATFITVRGTSMLPTLHTGDFVLAEAQPAYHAGDLVVYSVPRGQVGAGDDLIHRIVGGSAARGFTLKGDNNPAPDPWTVPRSDILGKETVVLPGAGNWLLFFHSPLFAGMLAAAVAVWMVLSPPAWLTRRRKAAGGDDGHPTSGAHL